MAANVDKDTVEVEFVQRSVKDMVEASRRSADEFMVIYNMLLKTLTLKSHTTMEIFRQFLVCDDVSEDVVRNKAVILNTLLKAKMEPGVYQHYVFDPGIQALRQAANKKGFKFFCRTLLRLITQDKVHEERVKELCRGFILDGVELNEEGIAYLREVTDKLGLPIPGGQKPPAPSAEAPKPTTPEAPKTKVVAAPNTATTEPPKTRLIEAPKTPGSEAPKTKVAGTQRPTVLPVSKELAEAMKAAEEALDTGAKPTAEAAEPVAPVPPSAEPGKEKKEPVTKSVKLPEPLPPKKPPEGKPASAELPVEPVPEFVGRVEGIVKRFRGIPPDAMQTILKSLRNTVRPDGTFVSPGAENLIKLLRHAYNAGEHNSLSHRSDYAYLSAIVLVLWRMVMARGGQATSESVGMAINELGTAVGKRGGPDTVLRPGVPLAHLLETMKELMHSR